MADLYDFPEIYDERFTDGANQAYKQHYEKMLVGKSLRSILDCSFGTGNLTFPLLELGYEVSSARQCWKRRQRRPGRRDLTFPLPSAISGSFPAILTVNLTAL